MQGHADYKVFLAAAAGTDGVLICGDVVTGLDFGLAAQPGSAGRQHALRDAACGRNGRQISVNTVFRLPLKTGEFGCDGVYSGPLYFSNQHRT